MPVTRGRLALPKCPEDCPADIFELIKDCTAHDPDDRPTAKECFERMKVRTCRLHQGTALSHFSYDACISGGGANVGTSAAGDFQEHHVNGQDHADRCSTPRRVCTGMAADPTMTHALGLYGAAVISFTTAMVRVVTFLGVVIRPLAWTVCAGIVHRARSQHARQVEGGDAAQHRQPQRQRTEQQAHVLRPHGVSGEF